MRTLIYFSTFVLSLILLVAGDPLIINLSWKYLNPGVFNIPQDNLKAIEKESYSEMFLVSKSQGGGTDTICMAIGPLFTMIQPVYSESFYPYYVDYYQFSSLFIEGLDTTIRDQREMLQTCKNHQIIYYFDQTEDTVTWMSLNDVEYNCGERFTKQLDFDSNDDNSMKSVFGVPHDVEGTKLRAGLRCLIFGSTKNDPDWPTRINLKRIPNLSRNLMFLGTGLPVGRSNDICQPEGSSSTSPSKRTKGFLYDEVKKCKTRLISELSPPISAPTDNVRRRGRPRKQPRENNINIKNDSS